MAQRRYVDQNGLLYTWQKLKTLLGDKVDKRNGYSLMSDAEISRLASVINYDDTSVQSALTTLTNKVKNLEDNPYDDTDIRGLITGIQTTITELTTKVTAAYTHSTSAHAPVGAQENVIEAIKVNGSATTITGKSVNITVPKNVTDLSDAGNYVTQTALASKGYAIANDVYTKTDIDAKLKGGMHYKGDVDTYADLPADPANGDMYNVKTADPSHEIKAGDNVVWNDETKKWDNQGGVIDLSGMLGINDVVTNEDIDQIFAS